MPFSHVVLAGSSAVIPHTCAMHLVFLHFTLKRQGFTKRSISNPSTTSHLNFKMKHFAKSLNEVPTILQIMYAVRPKGIA